MKPDNIIKKIQTIGVDLANLVQKKAHHENKTFNVLFSSTRQWNPGDEYIFFGCRNLFEEFFPNKKINWVLYDRNPDLFVSVYDPTHKDLIYSNVFCNQTITGSVFDMALVAGSPEWFGKPLEKFYNVVVKKKISLVVLGAGYINAPINFTNQEIIAFRKQAKLITVRDENAVAGFASASISCENLPCPALFASKTCNTVRSINKIGLILQTDKTSNQSIKTELKISVVNAFRELKKKGFEVDIICNYIDELLEFSDICPNIRYSYNAEDYIKITDEYDLIVSTRLHGAILANSLGKPAIIINDDCSRLKGAKTNFPYIIESKSSEILETISNCKTADFEKLCDWKQAIKAKYFELLKDTLDK